MLPISHFESVRSMADSCPELYEQYKSRFSYADRAKVGRLKLQKVLQAKAEQLSNLKQLQQCKM